MPWTCNQLVFMLPEKNKTKQINKNKEKKLICTSYLCKILSLNSPLVLLLQIFLSTLFHLSLHLLQEPWRQHSWRLLFLTTLLVGGRLWWRGFGILSNHRDKCWLSTTLRWNWFYTWWWSWRRWGTLWFRSAFGSWRFSPVVLLSIDTIVFTVVVGEALITKGAFSS